MGQAMTDWVDVAGAAGLGAEAELLSAIGGLAAGWGKLAGEVTGYPTALALLRAIADGLDDPSLAEAFERAGEGPLLEALRKRRDRIKARLDAVPREVGVLLSPIGTFDETATGTRDTGLVRWPLLDESVATPAPAPGGPADAPDFSYTLSLGASAALTIEAGDTWPYSDPMPGPLLRMRAQGALKAGASAALPFSVGTASAGAAAQAACALDYYFAVADPAAIFGLAAARRLAAIPDPFDFDAVWRAFADTDLAAIHYEFEGNAKVTVGIALADAAVLGADVALALGAQVDVGFALGGKHFLTFRAGPRQDDGTRSVIAAVSRQRQQTSDLSAKLGITVDLAGLAKRVQAILKAALDRSDAILAELTPYFSPGTFLQEQAGSLIDREAARLVGDDALRAALIRDLQGVIGVDVPDAPALANWLAGRLSAALDLAEGWAEEQGDAAARLIGNLAREVPAFGQADVKDQLEASADALVAAARDKLEAGVADIFARHGAVLGSWLQKTGIAAGGLVADADAALAGVRGAIGRYQALLKKLVEEAGNGARAKISAAIQLEDSRVSTTTMEVAGTFIRSSDDARTVFRALTRGDFSALLAVIDGEAAADFLIDRDKSSLRRFSQRTSKLGVEILLFGFGVTGSDLLTAQADVMVDGSGQVQVDAKAVLDRKFKGFDAAREITLVSAASLVWARQLALAAPGIDRVLGLSVAVSHVDDGLKRKELERFVGSVVDAGLLPPPVLRLAGDTFTRWAGNPGSNGKLDAAIALKLALDRGSLARMLRLEGGQQAATLPEAQSRAIVLKAFETLRTADKSDRKAIDATLAYLMQGKLAHSARDDIVIDRERTRRALLTEVSGSHILRIAREDEPFIDAVERSYGLRDMIEWLRRVYYSTPEERSDADPATWSARDYRDAERNVAKSVRGWLQLNNVLFWTDSKVHPHVIGLFQLMADLAGLDPGQAISLTITRRGSATDAETVVLSNAR